MTDIPRQTIVKSLKKKGFVHTKKSGDHDWYVYCRDGIEYKQIMAKISRGSSYKTYGQNLWKRMKDRLELNNNGEVADLLSCPMDRDTYLEILREKKLVVDKPKKKKLACKKPKKKKKQAI